MRFKDPEREFVELNALFTGSAKDYFAEPAVACRECFHPFVAGLEYHNFHDASDRGACHAGFRSTRRA